MLNVAELTVRFRIHRLSSLFVSVSVLHCPTHRSVGCRYRLLNLRAYFRSPEPYKIAIANCLVQNLVTILADISLIEKITTRYPFLLRRHPFAYVTQSPVLSAKAHIRRGISTWRSDLTLAPNERGLKNKMIMVSLLAS